MIRADVNLEIPFHDVDMMNVAWHGHYLKYFEIARCRLLDQLDYNYLQMQASGFAWPVIESFCRYARPLRFGQQVRVIAELKEFEQRLKISYTIVDAASGQRLTRGHTVQVAVDIQTQEMCFQSPAILLEKIHTFTAHQSSV